METILLSDLDKPLKMGEIEVFTADQLKAYVENANDDIQKSTGNKEAMMREVAIEIRSFRPVMTVDNDLKKSIRFIRPAQIAWDEPDPDNISKARSGTYLPTPENRKLGRVGRKYGE